MENLNSPVVCDSKRNNPQLISPSAICGSTDQLVTNQISEPNAMSQWVSHSFIQWVSQWVYQWVSESVINPGGGDGDGGGGGECVYNDHVFTGLSLYRPYARHEVGHHCVPTNHNLQSIFRFSSSWSNSVWTLKQKKESWRARGKKIPALLQELFRKIDQ